MRLIILFLFLITTISCNQKNKSNERIATTDSVYVYEPIGWKMRVPDNYEFLTKEDSKKLNEKGLREIKETTGEDFEVQSFNELLTFKKDQFNIFLSTSQVIDSLEIPSFEEAHNDIVEVLIQTYRDNNLKVDHKRGHETVDGQEFITDEFTLMALDDKYVMSQLMFSKLFGDLEFSATISWNKDEFRDEMLKSWRESEFGK